MRLTLGFLILFAASNVCAVSAQFWKASTPEAFLSGDVEGFAVTSRGELRPGPTVRKLATFVDPFVLSQAIGPDGTRYFGTGNGGKVYRLRGSELKAVYTAPEPEIYALAFLNGALIVASSPNGKIYRVDPESGAATTFFDPKQAYIWTLLPLADGSIAAGTGVEGKLFRITAGGEGKLLFDSADTHVKSVSRWRNGSLLAGGSGKGRIYEIAPSGTARALFESLFSEISTIYFDEQRGMAWAAGVSNTAPASAPPRPSAQPPKPAAAEAEGEKKKEGEAAATVEVSFSFEDALSPAPAGSAELYRIDADGYVETVRKFDREIVYSLAGDGSGSLFISTGPLGRIYELRDNDIALIATVPEKQVVSFDRSGPSPIVTTTNGGAVYQIERSGRGAAEYRSPVKDMERFSRLGRFRAEGNNLGNGLKFSFRSGNTNAPDNTWSAWSAPVSGAEGEITAPAARYVQWKATLDAPAPDLAITSVAVSFLNRNVKPAIDALTVNDPGVVFLSSGFPQAGQVVEATNPDENGIFTSLDSPRDRNEGGKKAFRKGYRTVSWKARDENGDSLRYSLYFRRKGAGEWLRLKENIEETQLNFDTSQLPDGNYELKLVATDKPDNPEQPLSDSREGVDLLVDNTPPSISSGTREGAIEVSISDTLSPVVKVEYSVDAEKWLRMTPVDGIADSNRETFRLPAALTGNRFVVIRAVDASFNVATGSVTLQR